VSSDRGPAAQDTRFSLPAVDALPSQEVGVILLGQEVESLLAGLGSTTLAAETTVVFLLVDQVRHAGSVVLTRDHLIRLGGQHWRREREMPGPAPGDAPLRQSWARAYHALSKGPAGTAGPARLAYLTACWLRRHEVDRYVDAYPGRSTSA
jgi:hypothetical protein